MVKGLTNVEKSAKKKNHKKKITINTNVSSSKIFPFENMTDRCKSPANRKDFTALSIQGQATLVSVVKKKGKKDERR